MDDLPVGCFIRLVVAASCHTTIWFKNDPAPWTNTVAWKFISSPTRGAIAWVGSQYGTYQGVNYVLSYFLQEELWNHPYRSMADSYLIALRRAYDEFEGNPGFLSILGDYEFLGDPVTPFAELPSATILASVENSYDHVARDASTVPLVSCPAGDGDKLIVTVDMDEAKVAPYASTSSMTLVPPPDYDPGVFQEGAEVTFMNGEMQPDAFQFNPGSGGSPGTYHAGWTIPNIGGSGADSALVSLFGEPIGWVKFSVKSFDTVPRGTSFGTVGASDCALLGAHYPSSICDCVYGSPYSPWCDFLKAGDLAHILPDTTINASDFGFWATHYQHSYTPPTYVTESDPARASGAISIELTEEQPLTGQRGLRGTVRMQGVEPFVAMIVAIRNEDSRFRFGRWVPATGFRGRTMCAQVVRNGRTEIMLGVLSDDASGIQDAVLGHFELDVLSDDPIMLTDQDFALVVADVLTEGREEKFIYGSSQSYSRTLVAASYANELAQNYPNPFNPKTVIAYSLAEPSDVHVTIYDVGGRRVRDLVSQHQARGVHRVTWDGRDGTDSPVASGVYFYKLVAGSFVDTRKMVLLK